jgi:hypothetical protein
MPETQETFADIPIATGELARRVKLLPITESFVLAQLVHGGELKPLARAVRKVCPPDVAVYQFGHGKPIIQEPSPSCYQEAYRFGRKPCHGTGYLLGICSKEFPVVPEGSPIERYDKEIG